MIHAIQSRLQTSLPFLKQTAKYAYATSCITGAAIGFSEGIKQIKKALITILLTHT